MSSFNQNISSSYNEGLPPSLPTELERDAPETPSSDPDTKLSEEAEAIRRAMERSGHTTDPRSGMGRLPRPAPPAPSLPSEPQPRPSDGDSEPQLPPSDPNTSQPRPEPGTEPIEGGTDSSKDDESSSDVQNSTGSDVNSELSEEARAIKAGFERVLGGRTDPRMGYGMIPKRRVVPDESSGAADVTKN